MKKLVIGILAHVDAGKTTLSEALLYTSGTLRKLGRVDHADAFLDTDVQERERGITIFSKQALMSTEKLDITLLDTPGHVDFSAEMERTLQVLDYAILVISGTDGVQGHTRTLWKLLSRYEVPTFVFVNKMDLAGADRLQVMDQLHRGLGEGFVDFTMPDYLRDEAVAMCDEATLDYYLEHAEVSVEQTAELIANRRVFPCWFGAALRLDGVEDFLAGLETYTREPAHGRSFGARVFKITYDSKTNTRLTWIKVTGGTLRAKALLSGGEGEEHWEEKADQLRRYSGAKYQMTEEAAAGDVIAVTGLSHTRCGDGLGEETESPEPMLEPVINYQLILPDGVDPFNTLPRLKQLEEEDPMLRIVWNEQWKQIHVRLMGQVQHEVLKRLILDRFGMEVSFGKGSVIYKETIAEAVEGIGHYEPLRHYAEVHLLMEPGKRGSGNRVASMCSTDVLEAHWQQLVLTHLLEREHPGVLTGSGITDMKITLAIARAHQKHTEGGDFRQATYRAIRHGLMYAKNILLEPYYDFTIELPNECVGRAMTDVQAMGGTVNNPQPEGEMTLLTGYAPVAGLQDYWSEVTAYTRGRGRLSCALRGYEPCHEQDKIVEAIGYDPERDLENPVDSVFCAHGGGFTVKWDQVKEYAHLDSGLRLGEAEAPEEVVLSARVSAGKSYNGSLEQDKELMRIFERTYGKMDRQDYLYRPPARRDPDDSYTVRVRGLIPQYLLVDGYNIIFAWDDLKKLAQIDIAAARSALEDILHNYHGFHKCEIILVFDAYRVKGGRGSMEKHDGIYVVYTREAQTADNYIEQTTYQLARNCRVRVATSDNLEQMIILGHNAMYVSADAFRVEVEQTKMHISELIEGYNMRNSSAGKLRDVADRPQKT